MRMGQGIRTGLGHGGITCVLQTQFSSCLIVDWFPGTHQKWVLAGSKNAIFSLSVLYTWEEIPIRERLPCFRGHPTELAP